ncbi:hypothetical protein ACFV5G_02230 [Streptomyces sp. NPDC059766]|uniref:hypothetical protein n=1 Tax=Streptomyces sp. NPDC059766 TaxID=3346940 RepID=UPI0036566DA4
MNVVAHQTPTVGHGFLMKWGTLHVTDKGMLNWSEQQHTFSGRGALRRRIFDETSTKL